MAYFAAILTREGENIALVENVFVADDTEVLPEGFTYVAAHANVFVGCLYDTEKREFVGVAAPEEIPDPDPAEPPIEPAPAYPVVSPVEFKLLFTAQERIQITAARAGDVVLEDFFSIIDDPRLTCVDLSWKSTQDGIDYIIARGLVASERREEILTGNFQ